MAMMVVVAAVLLTYGVSTGMAMISDKSGAVAGAGAGENSVLPLDMAENSVDDSYDGCEDKMKEKVLTEYLKNEKNTDETFKKVWKSSEEYALGKVKKGKTISLGTEQLVAIAYYTSGADDAYRDFNAAVRTQRHQYKTTYEFRYHALHFFLTTAIQALRANKHKKECLTGYRRVDSYFSQDVLNKEFRFGSFTSASLGDYSKNIKRFGEKSCFQIKTCMGADVSFLSKFEIEAEVLIPPYEVFKVVKIKKRSDQSDQSESDQSESDQSESDQSEKPKKPCEVVYRVESTRSLSKLNCALVPK